MSLRYQGQLNLNYQAFIIEVLLFFNYIELSNYKQKQTYTLTQELDRELLIDSLLNLQFTPYNLLSHQITPFQQPRQIHTIPTQMILACCCGKSRKDESSLLEGTAGPESRIKNINRILLEFVNEEAKIGLKEQPCIAMIEKVLLASNKGEIPKREIIQIYKALSSEGVNQNSIKNFLIQDFFFVDNTRQKYDFNKVVLFNLLYSGGKDEEKANFLFNIVESTQSSAVYNHSQKLVSTLENVTYISTIAVGEILNSVRRFTSEADDSDFQELLSLYSTNANMLREFSNHLSSLYLFPAGATLQEEKQYLNRQDFLKRVNDCAYLLIRPNEVRKKYTEYVWQNKARALLPSKLMLPRQRDSRRQDPQHNSSHNQSRHKNNEESKLNSSGFSEQHSEYNAHGRGTFSKHHNQSSRKQSHAQNDNRDDRHQHRQEKLERFGGGAPSQNNSHSQSNQKVNPYQQHYPQNYQNKQHSPNSRRPEQEQSLNSSSEQRQLQRQNSDISQMAIYRYEDKSARGSNNSPASRQQKHEKYQGGLETSNFSQSTPFKGSSSKPSPRRDNHVESSASSMGQPQQKQVKESKHSRQNSKGIQNYYATSRGNSPKLQSPKGKGHDIERDSQAYNYQAQLLSSKQLPQSQLEKKMSSNRESSDTQASLHSTKNLQKYQNVGSYLRELFGEQFVSLVAEMQEPFDEERQAQLQERLANIKQSQKLEFPDYSSQPYHIRELFEYFNAIIHKEDLLEFSKGRLFRENIINVYMKILEKISLIRQSQHNYQRATIRNSIDLYSATNQSPQKILYFNTNFARRLNSDQSRKDCLNQLQNFFKYDQVILPFFVDEENDQRALIVSVKVANFQVDLYDRERDHDNNDISDTVLHIMEQSSYMQQIEFSEDMVDGGVEGVCVQREEDMLVAMCYIAECITFNKPVDLETFNLNIERQRVLDVFLSLLSFS